MCSCSGRRTTTSNGNTVVWRHTRPDGGRVDYFIQEEADRAKALLGGVVEKTVK